MRILVDADACPVKGIIEKVAKEMDIPVIMFIDDSHILQSDYSEIVTIGQGRDAVDLALINKSLKGDVVVTQDFGVAALTLGKKAFAISNNGLIFDDNNIDSLLQERHMSQKIRRSGGRTGQMKKRSPENDVIFEVSFRKILQKITDSI